MYCKPRLAEHPADPFKVCCYYCYFITAQFRITGQCQLCRARTVCLIQLKAVNKSVGLRYREYCLVLNLLS